MSINIVWKKEYSSSSSRNKFQIPEHFLKTGSIPAIIEIKKKHKPRKSNMIPCEKCWSNIWKHKYNEGMVTSTCVSCGNIVEFVV